MKTTAERLLIRPAAQVRLVNPPPDGAALIGPLPGAAELIDSNGEADVVVLFARDAAELTMHLPEAAQAAAGDQLLWLAYPKGSSRVATDLRRDALTPLTDAVAGLTGVSLISINDVWSAMRLRPSSRYRT
jgi:hypothetical protein